MSDKALEKIANMDVVGVPHTTIAAACGVSESRISQIVATEQYKAVVELVAAKKSQELELLNTGWDAVEALGIKKVVDALKHNPEPDFALRAAAVANKATRRGGFQNNPINPQSAGVRAVIHLNPQFADKLQNNFNITINNNPELKTKAKDSDFMPAKNVHDLLSDGQKTGETIGFETPIDNAATKGLDFFPDMNEAELIDE